MKPVIIPISLLAISLLFVYAATSLIRSDETEPYATEVESHFPSPASQAVKASDGNRKGISAIAPENQESAITGHHLGMHALKKSMTLGNGIINPELTQNQGIKETRHPQNVDAEHESSDMEPSIVHSQPPDYPGPIVIGTPGID